MRISDEPITWQRMIQTFSKQLSQTTKVVSYTIYKVNTSSMWKLAKATKLWQGHSKGKFTLEFFSNGIALCTMTIPCEATVNKER
jgi:hypothetical protein